MELHQLRYFCAVVKAGNFTRAAEEQHIAQPSLSQQILKLEAELGARLFDRLARSAKLTQYGNAFLPKAEAILRQIGDAQTELRELAGADKGEVTVGAIPTIAPYFLAPVLAAFTRKHPGVTVRVMEEITPVLLDRLQTGAVDVALLALPAKGIALSTQELIREPLFLAIPETHRLRSAEVRDLQAIKNEPFLLLKDAHCFRESALGACRRSRIAPNVAFESGQFSTILAMVAAGMGVSIVPAMAVQPFKGCRFVRIRDGRSDRRIGIVQAKRRSPCRAHRLFVEFLRENATSRAEPQRSQRTQRD
jgi:LysR family transcriptional regulator, hydrogen peroxide-inducible genes activator